MGLEHDSTTKAKLDEPALARLRTLFGQYERSMWDSRYSSNSKSMRLAYVNSFIRWLEGTYDPGDYDGSWGQRG